MAVHHLSALLYFGIQRLRGGVTPSMIDFSDELLHSSWERIQTYVESRLDTVHGLDLDTLSEQPTMDRTMYRQRIRGLDQTFSFTQYESRHTSGSTGEPLYFYKDMTMVAWMDATMWAAYRWHGITPGDPQARFWGVPVDLPTKLSVTIRDFLLRRRRLSAFSIDRDSCENYFHRIHDWGANHAYGYPSLMRSFAAHCTDRGLSGEDLGLRVIVCTGELLTDVTRKRLEAFFGCPVINEYGCTESGILAFECEHGTSHLLPIAAWPTVEDHSRMNNFQGEILVTDLYGSIAPLLQYRLGDWGTRSQSSNCRCGRELPVLEVTQGRVDSFIVTPEGEQIYDALLAYTVPDDITKFRAIQTEPGLIEAEVIVGTSPDINASIAACQRAWSNALGSSIEVQVQAVESIEHDESGKLRYFVPLHEAAHGEE